jgi:hypothetical protein
MMDKNEAVQKLATVGRLSMSYAEDLYDSFFEKPVVPQYVADWYEENKKDFDYNLWDYLTSWDRQKGSDFKKWINNEIDVLQTLVNMHQFGYEVEKETKYTVRIKVTNQYLCNDDGILHFSPGFRMDFTKNDLEKLNLGWVFDCEGIEIVEVE